MKNISKNIFFLLAMPCITFAGFAQTVPNNAPWSLRIMDSEMIRTPKACNLDFQPTLKWDYCHGVELQAFLNAYDCYGHDKYFNYVKEYCDTMLTTDGHIVSYKPSELSLDRINTGKIFFRMYERTKDEKYRKAMDMLRSQLTCQPRTSEGGFWHKLVYPNQMWLDGIYMASPFYAEYTFRNNRPEDYQDVLNQFLVIARHTYDPANGLYRHAWDESKSQKWANIETGQSAHVWGRAMGWYAMALVDALPFIPKHEAGREKVLDILSNVAAQIKRTQDAKSGVWYQVLDESGKEGNYLEATVSTMFVYTLYKAVRLGYINRSYLDVAEKGYQGILKTFITVDVNGLVSINHCCAVAGLGGNPYRSGDYDYYIHEKIRSNDAKAVGPFINASLERELLHETNYTVK